MSTANMAPLQVRTLPCVHFIIRFLICRLSSPCPGSIFTGKTAAKKCQIRGLLANNSPHTAQTAQAGAGQEHRLAESLLVIINSRFDEPAIILSNAHLTQSELVPGSSTRSSCGMNRGPKSCWRHSRTTSPNS